MNESEDRGPPLRRHDPRRDPPHYGGPLLRVRHLQFYKNGTGMTVGPRPMWSWRVIGRITGPRGRSSSSWPSGCSSTPSTRTSSPTTSPSSRCLLPGSNGPTSSSQSVCRTATSTTRPGRSVSSPGGAVSASVGVTRPPVPPNLQNIPAGCRPPCCPL